jgi:hypothetical protein
MYPGIFGARDILGARPPVAQHLLICRQTGPVARASRGMGSLADVDDLGRTIDGISVPEIVPWYRCWVEWGKLPNLSSREARGRTWALAPAE